MKRFKLILVFACICYSFAATAQKLDTIEVSYYKTTILIFDSEIITDDAGSPDLLISKEGKILKCASAIRGLHETNLFVETGSGYYSFIVKYNENPKGITRNFGVSNITYEKAIDEIELPPNSNSGNMNSQTASSSASSSSVVNDNLKFEEKNKITKECSDMAAYANTIKDLGVISSKLQLTLADIAVKDDRLYFKLVAKNTSNIDYDIELIRFVTVNKKGKIKQAAVQEGNLTPVYIYNGEKNEIPGKSGLIKVFVFDKFTYADDKKLMVELWENGGERILSFAVPQEYLLNCRKIK